MLIIIKHESKPLLALGQVHTAKYGLDILSHSYLANFLLLSKGILVHMEDMARFKCLERSQGVSVMEKMKNNFFGYEVRDIGKFLEAL